MLFSALDLTDRSDFARFLQAHAAVYAGLSRALGKTDVAGLGHSRAALQAGLRELGAAVPVATGRRPATGSRRSTFCAAAAWGWRSCAGGGRMRGIRLFALRIVSSPAGRGSRLAPLLRELAACPAQPAADRTVGDDNALFAAMIASLPVAEHADVQA